MTDMNEDGIFVSYYQTGFCILLWSIIFSYEVSKLVNLPKEHYDLWYFYN